ncbi:MAG: CpsB/CapC family capsule biosynthesis tyrosine phosphatase [Gemmatimonadales bacterium]
MIDIHSHLLPAIDDGSRSVEQSVRVLDWFAAEGVTDVILTPHTSAAELAHDPEAAVDRRAGAFEKLAAQAPSVPKLHLGFEIMLDQPLSAMVIGDRRFSLAGSRYYLVEFHRSIAAQAAQMALKKIAQAGAAPMIAHPERYESCTPRVVAGWRSTGAKIQIDATALTRSNTRARNARQLVAHGLANVVAADNHGCDRCITTAVRFLEERGAPETAHWLATENAAAILGDRDLADVPAIPLREDMWNRIKNIMGR